MVDENTSPIGRPTRLTPEMQDDIIKVLLIGEHRKTAASYVGISKDVISHWMTRGRREPESIYGDFRRSVIKAESFARINALAHIYAAGQKDPKNFMWWLEKKYPKDWGKARESVKEDRTKPAAVNVTVNVTNFTMQVLEGMIERGERIPEDVIRKLAPEDIVQLHRKARGT